MRALVKQFKKPGLTLKEVTIPSVKQNEVLIKVTQASICGTDMHIFNWDKWAQQRLQPPRIIGHEITGKVVKQGTNVKNIRIGDQVALESHIYDNTCRACRDDKRYVCERVKILGIDVDGGFAEYIVMPERAVFKVPDGIANEQASLLEPFGNAVHACSVAQMKGKDVLVSGAGPIGLMSVGIAKILGAQVTATNPSEYRLQLAKRMGADKLIKVSRKSNALLKHTKFDVVLEMSGSPNAIQSTLPLVRNGGTMVLFGIPHTPVELELAETIIFKGITVYGIVGRKIWKSWEQAVKLLKRIDLSPIITHTYPLGQFDEAFELLQNGRCGKVVFTL